MENKVIRNLRANEIDCRIGTVKDNGAVTLLLYKDARADMDLLDETYGSMNWMRTHEFKNGNLYCTVSVWDEEKKMWISKEDVGIESNTEAEKGQASDSFKRSCVNFSLGRELYTAPFIYLAPGVAEVTGKKCFEKFEVSKIGYKKDENGNEMKVISELEIINSKSKKAVFYWKDKSNNVGYTNTMPKEENAAEPKKTVSEPVPEDLICENCKNAIMGIKVSTGFMSPETVALRSSARYGKRLCLECSNKMRGNK